MKNILIVILVFLATSLISQNFGKKVAWVADTTTDSETEHLVVATADIKSISEAGRVLLTVWGTNASGTATVTATPQGSDDNSKWYNLSAAMNFNVAGTVTDTSYTNEFSYFLYYRWKLVSTGTGVTYLGGGITIKRPRN